VGVLQFDRWLLARSKGEYNVGPLMYEHVNVSPPLVLLVT